MHSQNEVFIYLALAAKLTAVETEMEAWLMGYLVNRDPATGSLLGVAKGNWDSQSIGIC